MKTTIDIRIPAQAKRCRSRDGQFPVARPSLLTALASLKPLEEPFPAIEPLRAEPVEL